jgi:mRNA interferase RelE/StbE
VSFRLEYKSSVKKELRKLPKTDRIVIIRKISLLKSNPVPENSTKIKGSQDLFRIRHGDYRVVYQVQKSVLVVVVIRVGHRREIYRNL